MVSKSFFKQVLIKLVGRFEGTIEKTDGGILVNGHKVHVFGEKDPTAIPWGKAGADYIAECTGVFLDKDKVQRRPFFLHHPKMTLQFSSLVLIMKFTTQI